MKAMSMEELKRRALATGARLEYDGKTFNSGGRKTVLLGPGDETPPVVATQAPAPEQDSGMEAAILEAALAIRHNGILVSSALAELLPPPPPAPAGPASYTFKLKRDSEGDLSEVLATSTRGDRFDYRFDLHRNRERDLESVTATPMGAP